MGENESLEVNASIPEDYNTVVPRDEDTAIRESDLAAFKKAMEKE